MKKIIIVSFLSCLIWMSGRAAHASGAVKTIDVTMELSVTTDNPPLIMGESNLPDGARLSGMLRSLSSDCAPQCTLDLPVATVHYGTFSFSVEKSHSGKLKSGFYVFDVVFGAAGGPPEVQAMVGPKGQNLRGANVVVLSENSRYEPATFPRPALIGMNERMLGLMIRKEARIAVQDSGKVLMVGASRPAPEIRNGWYTLRRSDQVTYRYSINLNSVRPSLDGGAVAQVAGGPLDDKALRSIQFDCQGHYRDNGDPKSDNARPSSIEAQMSDIVCTLASP